MSLPTPPPDFLRRKKRDLSFHHQQMMTLTKHRVADVIPESKEEANSKLEPSDSSINCPADLPQFPVAFKQLAQVQANDNSIQTAEHHTHQQFCKHNPKVHAGNDTAKIVLPQATMWDTIKWCHHVLGHVKVPKNRAVWKNIIEFFGSPQPHSKLRVQSNQCSQSQFHVTSKPVTAQHLLLSLAGMRHTL